jgi:hypothetical protein
MCSKFSELINILSSNISHLSILTVNITSVLQSFNRGLIPTNYNRKYILVLIILCMPDVRSFTGAGCDIYYYLVIENVRE